MLNGDPHASNRSSSPLKRRASSMEPEAEDKVKGGSESQVTGSFPRAMSLDPPEYNASSGSQADEPPLSLPEQIKTIETIIKASKEAPLQTGQRSYVVSRSWVDKALALHPDAKGAAKSDDASDESLGPVDNSDIIHETITDSGGTEVTLLKPGSGLESFELFPEDAWNMVHEWYGVKDGQAPIIREAINQAPDLQSPADVIYELHPPIFQIHRLWSEISPLPIEQSLKANNPPPLTLVRSRKTRAYSFLKEVKTLAGIPLETSVRLHSISADQIKESQNQAREQPSERSALTPPDSPDRDVSSSTQVPWSHFLLDLPTFSKHSDVRMTLDLKDVTTNTNFNGKSTIQLHNLVTDQTLILDEQISNGKWVSNYTGADANRAAKGSGKGAMSGLSSKTNSGGSSPAPSGPLTQGRNQRKKYGRSLGAVGLHNLGNTCYMNSALQCVRSVEELTKYFLTDAHVDEINKGNPLGYNGRIALSYMGLLKEIYDEGRGSVTPREFKTTVGRCRSTFQGWGQQDSQEFLGFLLDGLQEDLSRIKKKPYIEKPDSTDDMINNPEAIKKMADEVWDITRRRDDSVIADLFTGMYKSTLKCPDCGKISITFDPFNNLTLPLPVENLDRHTVKFFPLNDVPVKLEVELPKHSAMEALKKFMSVKTGVPPERLMGAEEFKDRFFRIYSDDNDVSEDIQPNDIPTFHELEAAPTNWPLKRKKKVKSMLDVDTPADSAEWDDPAYERMAVPVFHRRPNAAARHDAAPPTFILLTRKEASDHDVIYRKVLERLANFSSYQPLHADEQSDKSTESDGVVINPSDAESGDSKVAAASVKGEEDVVDITMQDTNDKTVADEPLPHEPTILREFNKKRPSFMEPGSFLDPQLQNWFEFSYFYDSSDGIIPSGWQQADTSKNLPKITDRMPKPSVESDQGSPESWDSGSGNEESGKEDTPAKTESDVGQTRMAEESSEEDPSPHFSRKQPSQKFSKKNKFRNHKMGKKAKRREKQARAKEAHRASFVKPQPMPPAQADGGPLIRLSEGLVVDWDEDAYEAVFGDNRKTYNLLQVLEDKALKISQRRRSARRNRGITLDECLEEFERAEVLSEQDMWFCPRCKEHRRASKKFDLWKSPDILVAHLKRFSSSGYRRDKLDVLVDFPITGLDLTSRVIQKEDGKQEIYDLIGVDDHYGGLGGGHYTAYAKNFMDGRWYNYNDASVSQVSDPSSVVSSAAYLLFYRRRSSGPLGGQRFQEIFDKFDNPMADDGDSATEVGDDGSEDNFGGPGRTLSHHTTTTTIRPLAGSDDEMPNTYGHIQQSVEDEGLGMDEDPYGVMDSNPVVQSWSFGKSNNSPLIDATDSDVASDTAQVSQDEGDDVEMKSIAPEHSDSEGTLADKPVSVRPSSRNQRDSEEVAEIHVDGEKHSRNE